jgi:ATP-binding protein involved in chromosome partitioning
LALAGVKKVIAVASGKGGVGKSTVTTNLAVALRLQGARVGVLDADVYGPSQPTLLGPAEVQGASTSNGALVPFTSHGIKFISMGLLMGNDGHVVWRAPMAMKVIHQFLQNVEWGELDYLLIDLPPGTGDVQLTLAQQASLAGAVIVTTPQEVALGIAKKGLKMFEQLQIPILGIVENMSGFTCKHCGEETAIFKEGGGARMATSLKVPFLGAIPLDPEIMLSGDLGQPVLESKPQSPSSHAFRHAAENLVKELEQAQIRLHPHEPLSFRKISEGNLEIQWPDGHHSLYHAYSLRTQCGCANCVDENSGRRTLDPKTISLDIQFGAVQSVGRYALGMNFSDGHSTGIYPFKKLRTQCECASCSVKHAPQQPTFTV